MHVRACGAHVIYVCIFGMYVSMHLCIMYARVYVHMYVGLSLLKTEHFVHVIEVGHDLFIHETRLIDM